LKFKSFVQVFLILLLLTVVNALIAQPLYIKPTSSPIVLDGVMDELTWQEADVAQDFRQFFPFDSSAAVATSLVRMTYDNDFIYIFARMNNNGPRSYVTPSLRRDFRGEANDGISIVFDTFKDRTNGFVFGVNPFGVQREGLIANGGGAGPNDFSLNWDNKWYSVAKIYDDHWTAEIAIPFKTLRFKEGLDSWYINFYRIDSHFAERSTWSPIPRNFDIVNMAFNRELIWDKPLQAPGPNISVIPFVTTNSSRNFEKGTATDGVAVGGDAKIAVGPALNLDLTANPDFSQVEVDQQVTNLDRFEIFFPERRQFFLENADLFSNFGVDQTRPFFSRRIGVARDSSTGQNIQNPIYFGARLSGKVNNNLRVGLLNMQAGKDRSINLPSTNYTVATMQHKVWARSNIGVILVNKQAFTDSIEGPFTWRPERHSRVAGIDFNLASKNNVWNGKAFYHRSFEPNATDSAFASGAFINYSTYKWSVDVFTRNVGANYNPEVGFVRRRNIQQLATTVWRNYFPKSAWVQSHGPGFDFDIVRNDLYGLLDWDVNAMYRMRFKNTANFNMRLRREYTFLFAPFDPSGTNGLQLAAGNGFTANAVVANFNSDARKRFWFFLNSRVGQYFNGKRINIGGSLNYRMQPYGNLSIDFTYNHIRLPQPYNNADLVLVGPRFDFTFSRSVFWTTFVQYNSQITNMNINSRFQWRFKPVSDLFIVYTDNYFAESLANGPLFYIGQPKARAIVLKLTYWLNI
jgi:hypothetical protein